MTRRRTGVKPLPEPTRTTRTPAFWRYPRRLNDYPHYWVMLDPPSQNKVEWPWRYRSRSKVMICNRPPHASDHLYQIWKESCRAVDATEQTRFLRSRPNDLDNIGQGHRSLHATHALMLMMICAKYGKNPSRTVDFFQGQGRKILKICQKFKLSDSE